MIPQPKMDKARLAAFADGELSPESAAEVVMHLASHPADQAYVDQLMAANELLGRAFEAPLHEPAPPAIIETVLGKPVAQIVPFRRRRAVKLAAGLALAASVAVAAFGVANLMGPQDNRANLAIGPLADDSPITAALNELPSGTQQSLGRGQELLILATLPVDGGFCREVEIVDTAAARIDLSIACRRNEAWTVELVLTEPLSAAGTPDGFVAASGPEVEALDMFLDRLGAGAVLDAGQEAEAMARGWQPAEVPK